MWLNQIFLTLGWEVWSKREADLGSKRVQDVELGSKAQTGNQPVRDFLR